MQLLALVALICSAHGCLGSRLHRMSKRQPSGNNSLIVGGHTVLINEFPFVVHLLVVYAKSYYSCGASILNTKFVLTAAHCVYGESSRVIVSVGSTSIGGAVNYTSTRHIIYPYYKHGRVANDIAIVETLTHIVYDRKTTLPAVLADPGPGNKMETGTSLTALGWGRTVGDSGGPAVNQLNVLVGVIIATIDCALKGIPAIYTDIAPFRKWITSVTNV